MMKPLLLAIAVTLLAEVPAQCRIGENLDQLKARFGEGRRNVGHIRKAGHEQYTFVKDGLTIECVLANGADGTVIMEVFYRGLNGTTEEDIKAILKSEGDDLTWRVDRETSKWIRSDKKLEAFRMPGHPSVIFVQVITEEEGSGKAKKGVSVL